MTQGYAYAERVWNVLEGTKSAFYGIGLSKYPVYEVTSWQAKAVSSRPPGTFRFIRKCYGTQISQVYHRE